MSSNTLSIEEYKEWNGHKGVIHYMHKPTNLSVYIALHKNDSMHPYFGATRIWQYPNVEDAVQDSLKLSRIMTYKSVMAGYKYGGAKAIILRDSNNPFRSDWISVYADIINELRGLFITGADVGMTIEELQQLAGQSSYIMGIKTDPVAYTIDGLIAAIRVGCKHVFSDERLYDRTMAIQGLGKIGFGLLEKLANELKDIYVTDINIAMLEKMQQQFPHIHVVNQHEIYSVPVDIFSPCALSNILNEETAPQLQCKMIIGSANSQLSSDAIADSLFNKGIYYLPDYIVNAGGLMAVVNEYELVDSQDEKIKNIPQVISKNVDLIMTKSKEHSISPLLVSNTMAEDRMKQFGWI